MPIQSPPPIQTLTRTFLDAYARDDTAAVLPLLDADRITVYGSDISEIVHGHAAFLVLMADDARLWQGSAHIGAMQHISTVVSGNMATIFFDATFAVGNRPGVPIRCALVWQRHGNRWLLRQAANVVPTTGQSAEELLAGHNQ
jgi:ketosteroid isomerase-like protein